MSAECAKMRPKDADRESQEDEIDDVERQESPEIRQVRERHEGKRGYGRCEEGQRTGCGCDHSVLDALLDGVDVQMCGISGAEHVAGGVVGAEVSGAVTDGIAKAGTDDDLENEKSTEVELEAFGGEVCRPGICGHGCGGRRRWNR